MNHKDLEIQLNLEEQTLLDDITNLQDQIDEADPSLLNGQLLESIKSMAIETISTSLGISDIFEDTARNSYGLEGQKEYKTYLEWESKPKSQRSKVYQPKYINQKNFEELLNKELPLYNRKEYTKKGDGLSQKDTQHVKWKESQKLGGIRDAYTGKFISNNETVLKNKYEFEHVKSAKEVNDDPVLNYFLSLEKKRNFLNSPENLVPVKSSINNDKRALKIGEVDNWLKAPNKKNPKLTNKEFHNIDEKLFKETIQTSINKEKALLEKAVIKTNLKSKAKVAVKNAAKSAAKAAVGKLLSITVVEVVNEFKKDDKTTLKVKVKSIQKSIIGKSKDILKTLKDQSISSFISTFLDAILNSLFKIAKNIFKFIKLATLSIFKAIKILISKKGSSEDRTKEALKILGVTVASLIGLALDEIIEKTLITYLPITAPFAGYISPVLSGLIVGLGSVLLLQGFQEYQSNIKFKKLKGEQLGKSNKLSKVDLAKASVTDTKATEAILVTWTIFKGTLPIIESCNDKIKVSLEEIRRVKSETSQLVADARTINNDNDDLLNQLEAI